MTRVSDVPVFDLHQHVGELKWGTSSETVWTPQADRDARLRVMDPAGISSAAVLPSLQYERPSGQDDTKRVNDMMADYRDRFRDRFPVAIGTVEPLHGIELGINEIGRIADELHLDGVVWYHRFQGSMIADPRMFPFLEEVQKYKLVAMIHIMAESTLESPWGLELLATKFPELTFVALDAFSGYTQLFYVQSIAERCPNVIFDTAMAVPLGRLVEQFAHRFGAERVTFGTDLYSFADPYQRPAVLEELLESTMLNEEQQRKILWGNAARLFGF
jgi:predicted TIM-barrel fold metal-dependent hydrolase